MGTLNIVRVGRTSESSTSESDIAAILGSLSKKAPARLVIHFHGGLVPAEDGNKIADKMARIYGDVGCHAVTFVWETGIVETLRQGLDRVDRRPFFKRLLRHVIFFALKSMVVDGARGGETVDMDAVDAELRRNGEFEKFGEPTRAEAREAADEFLDERRLVAHAAEIEAMLSRDEEIIRLVSDSSTNELPEALRAEGRDGERGLLEIGRVAVAVARIVGRVLGRFGAETDHGLYHTAIEEILREFYLVDAGRFIWNGIKTRAAEMWAPLGTPRVGAAFLDGLKNHVMAHPDTIVDLVGHSAGSIVICHLLRAARSLGIALPFRNVILLAPACTMELLAGELADGRDQFKNFRIFAMKDELERQDKLLFPIYNRSLLYLVSGVLEPSPGMPLAGMHRHLGAGADSHPVRQFVHAKGENRLVLSMTGRDPAEGLRCDSVRHGDFDDDFLTLESLTRLAKS